MFPEKTEQSVPPYVVAAVPEVQSPSSPVKKSWKKYVIISVTSVVLVALVLAAILIGMYMFTEAQKEILQFTIKLNGNQKEEVRSDPNKNVIQYHVQESNQEAWIVNDYNIFVSVMKIQTATETVCYATPLNKTKDLSLDEIKQTDKLPDKVKKTQLVYKPSNSPIPDTSFLSDAARDVCKGVSIYWLYPDCESPSAGVQPTANLTANTTGAPDGRSKRAAASLSGFCSNYYYLPVYGCYQYYYLPYSCTYYYWCGDGECYFSYCYFNWYTYYNWYDGEYYYYIIHSCNLYLHCDNWYYTDWRHT